MLRWKHMIGILTIPVQGMLYVWISERFGANSRLDYTWIDTKIPFVEWFIFPYMSWMPVLYASFIYLAIRMREIYWRTLIIYNIAVMAGNICFWLFPTYVPRPDIPNNDRIHDLVNFMYQADAPYNCFPSIHCLTSYLLFITLQRQMNVKAPLRTMWSVLLWLIIASTVFVKQHSLLDVLGGIAFAEIVYRLVYYAYSRNYNQDKEFNLKY
ncbi:phosphatase PAP2 family protein [Paenibacillus terricola]|uniref:phosphatase PAP2 family protein n=1 Tax=Paenibacillus terricola TaxID=2763503 RepID=UPI0029652650|nr:phosphatase PAP2 family protein [Paenibacillus terricola]